ncbi:DUF397 domain-containing protein [Saccharothrix longispora]|uniref:DUF397 domain-containing protein n=1 Tax=Saccharothrix longispora TaxID=33920 RepID=UPI0028FD309F|nr:DUF397 domain-containing protein [Saccharothrix longispora]MBY8853051.1 DUF397 domain-containing protein [Saccharothrix sp. MB29]MDU0289546.1 DUF397 domain-containing protein [Saccharothrix longispora]
MTNHPEWRKSSYSTGDGGGNECVEVTWSGNSALVRDSKNPRRHLRLTLTGLLGAIKAGHFDA